MAELQKHDLRMTAGHFRLVNGKPEQELPWKCAACGKSFRWKTCRKTCRAALSLATEGR